MKEELSFGQRANHAEATDDDGDMFAIDIDSMGSAVVTVRNGPRDSSVILSNLSARTLRDMLNKRFPS